MWMVTRKSRCSDRHGRAKSHPSCRSSNTSKGVKMMLDWDREFLLTWWVNIGLKNVLSSEIKSASVVTVQEQKDMVNFSSN